MSKKSKKELRDAYACHNNWFWSSKTKDGKEKPGLINYIMGTIFFIWIIKVWVNYPYV